MKEVGETVRANSHDLAELVFAAGKLSAALYQSGYVTDAQAILAADQKKTEGENAVAFVKKYADLTGVTLDIVSKILDAVANAADLTEAVEDAKEAKEKALRDAGWSEEQIEKELRIS